MTVPSVRLLAAAVVERLKAAPGLSVHESAVIGELAKTAAGKTTSYVVVHPGPGTTPREGLDGQPGPLLWSFQTTCGGGDHDYLLGAVDVVRSRLDGQRLVVAGAEVGLIQPPAGFQPPPARPDRDDRPTRFTVPLLWQVLAVPA